MKERDSKGKIYPLLDTKYIWTLMLCVREVVFCLGSVWVCDFKKCDLKKVIFKNAVKRLAKL